MCASQSPSHSPVQVPSILARADSLDGYQSDLACLPVTCPVRVYITNTGDADAFDVQLAVHSVHPVVCTQETTNVGVVHAGATTPCTVHLDFSCSPDCLPTSLEVRTLVDALVLQWLTFVIVKIMHAMCAKLHEAEPWLLGRCGGSILRFIPSCRCAILIRSRPSSQSERTLCHS